MLLNHLKNKKEEDDYNYLIETLVKILKSLEIIEFIYCIHRIQINFKEISEQYITRLVYYLPQLFGEPRLYCAESILSAVSKLEDLIYTKPYFIDMLQQRNSALQLVCLKIIFELIDRISDANILTILPILTTQFLTHTNVNCRYQLAQILINLFNKHINLEAINEYSNEILKISKNSLLKLLIDSDQTIQWMAFNFWSDKAYLSNNTIDRVVSILNKMYASETELEFLSYSTNLLLEKTSKSPDYNRLIYENPLTECTFREYNLPVDWWRRHEVMTPLFVETLSTLEQTGDHTFNDYQLRATQQQSFQFQPTQDARGPYNWLTQSSLDTYQMNLISSSLTESQTTLLFNTGKKQQVASSTTTTDKSKDDSDRDIFRLRRRFLREDKVAETKYHARRQVGNILF
jgi:DNA-dependent protein kinase catalytic subunit